MAERADTGRATGPRPAGGIDDPQVDGRIAAKPIRSSEYVLTKEWPGEHERLRLLERVFDDFSIDAIRAAGFCKGFRCLEIGAGSGSIARWFASEAGDPGLVTATDIDLRLLEPLADLGIRTLQHDVATDEFPAGSFDLIHARSVLEHTAQREEVLDRIVPWLAPGGTLVINDCASFPLSSSINPHYRKVFEATLGVLALTGTDYEWARSFPEPLRRHGYQDLGVSAIVPPVQGGTPIARFWSLTMEALRQRVLDADLLEKEEIDYVQTLLTDPEFFDLGPAHLVAWGRRPGGL